MRKSVNMRGIAGLITVEQCDGSSTTAKTAEQTYYTGVLKSPVIASDGFIPTDYRTAWYNQQPGQYRNDDFNTATTCGSGSNIYYGKRKVFSPITIDFIASVPGFDFVQGPSASYLPSANFSYANHNRLVDAALLQKIKDNKLSLGVTAGEAKESVDLVLDLVEDVVTLVKHVKTGLTRPGDLVHYLLTKPKGRPNLNGKPHWPKVAKAYDEGNIYLQSRRRRNNYHLADDKGYQLTRALGESVANRWLQFRYGMIPLYNDVNAILEYVVTIPAEQLIYSARVTIPFSGFPMPPAGAHRKVISAEVNGFQQKKVWYKVSDTAARKKIQEGWHPSDILRTAYELIPFSFMLDWLWPLGDTLENLNATVGLTFYAGYHSMKVEVTNMKTIHTGGSWSGKATSPLDDANVANCGAFERRRITSFPMVTLPSFRNPFGEHTGQRIADVVSIIFQTLTGSVKRAENQFMRRQYSP